MLYEGDCWLNNHSLVCMGVFTNKSMLKKAIRKYFDTNNPRTTWAMGVASEHIKEISYNGQITKWSINNTKLTMELENRKGKTMENKNYWKIMGGGHTILTDCPNTFKDGDGVYYLMKRLQQIYGAKLCGFQKFDDRFDKIEDFDTILKTGFNLDGNRLISCHLFEYDKDKNEVTINRGKPREMEVDYEYAYRITKKRIGAKDGWSGMRRHILWTMGEDSCWRTWGDEQFGRDFKEKYFNRNS